MPDLIQTRFSIDWPSARIAVIGFTIHRHERELDEARPGASLDFDDALANAQLVEKCFFLPFQEQSPSGGQDVFLMLQSEKDLTITIAQDVDGHE